MSDDAGEPFVILERSGAPALRHWTALRGRKPALLLIDRGAPDGSELDLPLAAEGFDVYRTTGQRSALDLLEAHPSVLMALVRMDLPNLDAVALIHDLRTVRPGLWIGLLCDPADRTLAAAGYAAGAVDLFPASAARPQTVERLLGSVPWALRLREKAEGRRQRPPAAPFRRFVRRAAPKLRMGALLAVALLIGVSMALLTRAWQESRDVEEAKIERLFGILQTSRPPFDREERRIDRWQRQEQLDLQRRSQQTMGAYYQSQLEQERLRDLLRLSVPNYPTR